MSSKDASKQIPEADFPSLDAHNQTTLKVAVHQSYYM